MTKFEEEFDKNVHVTSDMLTGRKICSANQAKALGHGWVSPETHQARVNELIAAKEENIELLRKNATLKSQLQQQALPVVPECVGEWIEHCKGMGYGLIAALTFKLSSTMHEELSAKILKWLGNEGNDEAFALAFITGKYEVEKPQLFRLKLKNTPISNYYLWLNQATGKVFVDKKFLDWTNHDNVKNIFMEQEIAKISDGAFVNNKAFELVPVEDGE